MILVSKSPRRKAILELAGYKFKIHVADVDETFPEHLGFDEIPVYLAEKKALHVANDFENEILIAADTIVVIQDKILGKPKDMQEAYDMLSILSGNVHTVITGGCVVFNENIITFSDKSLVYFRDLTDDEILYYIENFKPLDKAGAYGVQDWIGVVGIEKIDGSFYNVMGLPMHKVYKALELMSQQISKFKQ